MFAGSRNFRRCTIITVVVFVVIQVWSEQLLAGALLDTSSLYPFPVLVALDVGGTASLSAGWNLARPAPVRLRRLPALVPTRNAPRSSDLAAVVSWPGPAGARSRRRSRVGLCRRRRCTTIRA